MSTPFRKDNLLVLSGGFESPPVCAVSGETISRVISHRNRLCVKIIKQPQKLNKVQVAIGFLCIVYNILKAVGVMNNQALSYVPLLCLILLFYSIKFTRSQLSLHLYLSDRESSKWSRKKLFSGLLSLLVTLLSYIVLSLNLELYDLITVFSFVVVTVGYLWWRYISSGPISLAYFTNDQYYMHGFHAKFLEQFSKNED